MRERRPHLPLLAHRRRARGLSGQSPGRRRPHRYHHAAALGGGLCGADGQRAGRGGGGKLPPAPTGGVAQAYPGVYQGQCAAEPVRGVMRFTVEAGIRGPGAGPAGCSEWSFLSSPPVLCFFPAAIDDLHQCW